MGKIVRRGINFSGGGGSISNPTAASVTFDNTDTGLNATNVQDAVTEVNGKCGSISNPTASSVTFDNTDTGLEAANVQDAITEVNGKLTKAFPTDNAIHSLDDKIRIAVYSGGLALQLSIDESKDYYVMLSFDQSGFAYIRNDSNGYVSKRIV